MCNEFGLFLLLFLHNLKEWFPLPFLRMPCLEVDCVLFLDPFFALLKMHSIVGFSQVSWDSLQLKICPGVIISLYKFLQLCQNHCQLSHLCNLSSNSYISQSKPTLDMAPSLTWNKLCGATYFHAGVFTFTLCFLMLQVAVKENIVQIFYPQIMVFSSYSLYTLWYYLQPWNKTT